MTNIVFDIGNVLVDWQPHLAWSPELTREEAEAFMARIDFPARNLRGDGGETFTDMANELSDPQDARRLREYATNFAKSVRNEIPGTWAILERLKSRWPVHAITNWSAETWPEGIAAHPRLGEVFDVTIVSGQEKTLKPDPAIFALLCERANTAPQDCLFIDDSPKNVAGAKAAGWDAIHFTAAPALEADLIARGLL